MQLYYVVGSPNCRKVHAVINHLCLDVDLHYLGFFNGDLRKPDYLSVNANGKVPALRDGEFVLWESNAIMQYLADKAPGNALLPKDGRGRADVLRWQCWELAHFNRAFGVLSWETVAKPGFLGQSPDAALVKWSTQELTRFAAVLDAHLDGRRFVVGDDLTLADYSLAHLEGFKDTVPFDWKAFPNVDAYFQRMRVNPHWAKTAPPSREAIGHVPVAA
jgi:glutathione S-transferase